MSADAEIPGLMSVINRIGDADVRFSVAFLADELQRSRSEMHALKVGQDNMMTKLDFISDSLCKVPFPVDAHERVLWPLPPTMIAADSPHSSALSLSSQHICSQSSQSLTQSHSSSAGSGKVAKRRREVDVSADRVRLQCPFCPSSHWNEKSHVQHVERAMERYA
jgi:hypothetical protein